jgi:outer membrane protein insertion porin family
VGVGIGTLDPEPTALYGPNRVPIVLPDNGSISTLSLPLYYAAQMPQNQRLVLELEGDNTQLGGDLSYSIQPQAWAGRLSANIFAMRGRFQATEAGRYIVGLYDPPGAQTWFYQAGGGLEYSQRLDDSLALAAALNLRETTVHSGAFTPSVQPYDQYREPLTVSPTGKDTAISVRVVGLYTTLDDLQTPTRGTKIRFGAEQDLPFTSSHVATAHAEANLTQFMPLSLASKGQTPSMLIFNLQGGTIFNTVAGYDAYSLGGVNSVRGYAQGDFGTGRSFVQSTLECRVPLGRVKLLSHEVDLRGSVFADFASTLGTQGSVLGRPAILRGKPGEGGGLGAGLHATTPLGLVRLEAGVNNLGATSVYLTIGDRY